MRVVHICSSISGGAGRAALRLHLALREAGVDSKMLTMRDADVDRHIYKMDRPIWARILSRFFMPTGQAFYNEFYKKYNMFIQALSFPDAWFDCSLSDIIQSADVINLHWVGNMLNYRKFFTNVRKPIIWTLHDMNPFMGALHFASDMEKLLGDDQALRLERKISEKKAQAYKNTTKLTIAPLCHWMKEASASSAAFLERPHILVKNCVDVNVFNPQAGERSMRINFPTNKKILLYVSQHINNPRKGSGILQSASTQLPQNCILVVVGDGSIEGGDNIINVGRVDSESELSWLYASADALVLPSIEDNLPNTMLEALCCGTPVLAFDQGGMRDVIEHGKSGLLSSDMTAAGLLSMIESFCANGVEWARESIAEQAHALFSPEAVAGQYVEIYRQLLK